jgi:2-hydroxychromene-2-carboxylate isomerase
MECELPWARKFAVSTFGHPCHYRSQLVALAAISLVSLGASCDRGPRSPAVAGATPADEAERVERLEGVDTSELTDTELELWQTLINEQLSPCGDPLSVGRCASTRHKCGACITGARYLTRLVMEGYDKQTIEQHYTGRFGEAGRAKLAVDDVPVRGAPMAPVTIVEYSDFQCPYCSAAHPELERLVREFEGQVKLVFKHFPLSSHLRAVAAARAAEAARRQGKFWEMHDVLFAHQRELEDTDLERYAGTIGLDMERFKRDFASSEVQERVEADRDEGLKLGIEGTPTIYVNGRLLREPLKALPAYLREELEL